MKWHRAAALGAAVLIGSYVGAVVGAYGFLRYYRGIEGTRVADIAWPPRRANLRRALGDHEIAEGRRRLEQKKYREAEMLLRIGLRRSPANRDGRLLLATLDLGLGRPELAAATLSEGLAHHRRDPRYMERVYALLLWRQEDAQVQALAQRALADQPAADLARLSALAAATAAYFRGNDDAAEDFLRRTAGIAESRDGRLLLAKIEADRGYPEIALLQLRRLAREFPADAEIHRDLVARLRKAGRMDEARRASLAFQLAQPAQPWPRVEVMRTHLEAGEREPLTREAEEFLRDLAGDESALQALAEFAAHSGEVALARRVAEAAAAHGHNQELFALLEVEAQLVAGDFAGALAAIQQFRSADRKKGRGYDALLDCFEAVAHFAAGDAASGRLLLTNFLARPVLRADNLLAIAERLSAIGADDAARQTLARAVQAEPLNQPVLTRLVYLELALHRTDELPGHLCSLLQMRRPSMDVVRVSQRELGSDLYLFSPDAERALAVVSETREKLSRLGVR